MVFIIGIIIGLLLNYIFGGFAFNTILCFFVGIFLIMPILLKIRFKGLRDTLKNKKLMGINILLNFIITPLLAFIVSYFIFGLEYYPYIFALILLSIIPGGGLLMNWLNNTKANLHVGFSLFAINLLIFSFVFMLYNVGTDMFINNYNKYFKTQTLNTYNISTKTGVLNDNFLSNPLNISTQQKNKQVGCAISNFASKVHLKIPGCNFLSHSNNSTLIYGFYGFIVLILIPFILSRIILLFIRENHENNIFEYINYISKVAAFILIVYIFSLSYIRDILNIKTIFIIKSIMVMFLFYALLYLITQLVLKFSNFKEDISKSIFWNSFSRFITLALVLSVLYAISWKEPGIIIIPVLAYFVQIMFASLISMYYEKWKF